MNMYSIRVELHGATWTDYTNLAAYLSNRGIVDVITGNDGLTRKMSPGEYNYDGPRAFDEVYDAAKWCADLTGKPYAVTMSEVTRWKWIGLKSA